MNLYDHYVVPRLVSLAMRNTRLAPYRGRALSRAEGRVLEIGIGSGMNLPLYGDRAQQIVGLDPSPKLLVMASQQKSGVRSKLIEGSAEHIPLDDASVDTVVSTWTLCSIPKIGAALAEMRRVLKPGGRLLFVEHGLAPDESVRRWQHRLTPVWKRIAGGCHLDRPIPVLVQDAGFEISHLQTGYIQGPKPMTFTFEGCAHGR